MRIGKELSALQGVLREWFYTCYVMGTATIFIFQVVFWTLFGRYVELERERRRQALQQSWEAGLEMDHGADAWEAVPGEDDDEWDDLPTEGLQDPDRPVTPDHPHDNDEGETSADAAANPTEADPLLPNQADGVSSEDVRAARVIRGYTEPYEVFTGEGL